MGGLPDVRLDGQSPGPGGRFTFHHDLGGNYNDNMDMYEEVFRTIDADRNGSISKLELFEAAQRHQRVSSLILPGLDCRSLMTDEKSFDAADALFDSIAGGKQRIKIREFVAHFRRAKAPPSGDTDEIRSVYRLIDADGNGSISKLELVAAVMRNPRVSELLLPGVDTRNVLSDEEAFDAVNSIFEAISGGKQRIYLEDFEEHFKRTASLPVTPRPPSGADRARTRLFIIGPGFGQQLNPRQSAMVCSAGYQIQWFFNCPNPEQPNFPVQSYLGVMRQELEAFRPDVVAAASKGGVYLVGLWESGIWRGPSLLLNAHPSCRELPQGVPIVIAQGSNDEVYPTRRADLERLVSASVADNRCLLYYTANSGRLPGGQFTRVGDMHNMESLLLNDCLPRLIDATRCAEGPETHLIRTWSERLGADRRDAEAWLGLTPEAFRARAYRRFPLSDDRKLFEVAHHSEEYRRVATVFYSKPKEPPAYTLTPQASWDRCRISKIERVENWLQFDGSARPYFDNLRRSLEDQNLALEPGAHTFWAFHGADENAIDSIVSNPVAGFQPLVSGTRNSTLWGSGTYFARDAKYVADGGFCGNPTMDGSRKMLLCLMLTGMPCLGDPEHKGVLPFRHKPHRYHSSVDSLSSPEIFITQHPGAAIPAYVITFIS